MIIRGKENKPEVCRLDTGWCRNSDGDIRCQLPKEKRYPCKSGKHVYPAYEHKTIFKCEKCSRLWLFRICYDRCFRDGFNARWESKLIQRIMPWDKR